MTSVRDIIDFLSAYAPTDLAEEWDNVGLLLGDYDQPVNRLLTCLTLTEDVADEAVQRGADLVVSHHPILFRKVQRITTDTAEGRTLLKLAGHNIAVYSPHTSYDSAPTGINQQLAEALSLESVRPLRECEEDTTRGSGRYGHLSQPLSLSEFLTHVKQSLALERLQYVAGHGESISGVGVACGSAAEFLSDARRAGCDALITGEARFHSLLEARARGMTMVLLGHFSSERPAMEHLATVLAAEFPEITAAASDVESDPLEWA